MTPAHAKVSVLVAVKESGGLLRGCLESLRDQTILREAEIVVIDSSSTDRDKKIACGYQKKFPQFQYLFVKEEGLFHAWNIGIRASEGQYLTNLNSDDRLKNDALEIMSRTLDRAPEIALVYADSLITEKADETFEKNSSGGRTFGWPHYSHARLLRGCFCGPHPMWRRKLHDEMGYFDPSFRLDGDYEFWLRIAEKYPLRRIPQALGLFYANPKCLRALHPELKRPEDLKIKRRYLSSR